MAYINNLGQVRIGVRGWVAAQSGASVTDSDATAFVTAAGITDSTQISALNTLVTDLKTYGLWTKMKAIYPFVGGSAASHKFNLKDPRDLDAAYRLVFNGGWVHSSNGALPNGTTGYADTKLVPSGTLSVNSTHILYYSRTNISTMGSDFGTIGSYTYTNNLYSYIKYNDGKTYFRINRGGTLESSIDIPDSRLFYMINRTSSSQEILFTNTTKNTFNYNSTGLSPFPVFLGASNKFGTGAFEYSSRESAFASIGDGLTDTEASNFYISVQKFQTTLGRQVGTPYVSDPDAIAFLMAAGITDGTQASAINTLVIRMKADGVWTKMKAIYPFVGGSAASHKFNLKDPRDLDVAFRLVFNGGWTHTGTGAKPNGTTGYANTYLNPKNNLGVNSGLGVYSRTNDTSKNQADMGAMYYFPVQAFIIGSGTSLGIFMGSNSSDFISFADSDTRAFYQVYRTNSTTVKSLRNTTSYSNTNLPYSAPNLNVYIGARNEMGIAQDFGLREVAFAYMQENFTDVDALNLYSAVQAYQTTLGRQVNVPLVSDTDAQAFLNAANITSFQQASAVNKLVVDLKAAGVWTKMKAIYPFVGGSAASHKWNLKDPRDLDAAYRLVFTGGWTHSSTGALPNGTTGYADTKYNLQSLNQNNTHLSIYNTNNYTPNPSNGSIDIGAYREIINPSGAFIATEVVSGLSRARLFSNPLDFSSTDNRGYYIVNSNSTGSKYFINNDIKSSSVNSGTFPLPSRNIFIGALNGDVNGDGAFYYANGRYTFASIGDGLTDTDTTVLYNAVQTYQTSLGRLVNTPIYNNGLVLNLDAGNANSYPGTGTTWFDLASGNNGTLINGPTYDFNNGGSLYFDGTNKYTDISYTKINITNKLTINAWVYFLSQPSTSGNPNIVDKWDWPNNKRAFSLGTENGYLSTSISYDGLFDNRIVCSDNSSIILNQWINITMTYDGRTLKLYKNGSLIQSSSFSQDRNIFSDITTNIFLGRSRGTEGSSRHLNARISGVQIYSNSITPTEILNNFNSTRGRFGL